MDKKNKKPTYKELADYLGVGEQSIKQYRSSIKRNLLLHGLWRLKEKGILEKETQELKKKELKKKEKKQQEQQNEKQ